MRKLFALAMAAALFGAVEASADSVTLLWQSTGTNTVNLLPGQSATANVRYGGTKTKSKAATLNKAAKIEGPRP